MILALVVVVKNSKSVAQLSYFTFYEDILTFTMTNRRLNRTHKKSLNKENNNA